MIGGEVTTMVGEQLAGARRASGLSLEDLARRTKIPATRLQALEAGLYELLPPPIFSRGFVRAYATEVGLDPEALVRQYDVERPPAPTEGRALPATGLDEEWPQGAWSRAGHAAMLAFGVAVVAILIWTGREPSERAASGDATPRSTAAQGRSTPDPVATTGNQGDGQVDAGVSVVLSAERVCWVAATADGQRAIYRLMQPGEKARLDARERIVLRAGDAGGLRIAVDDGAPQVAGADGEVRTLTFATKN
jgi:cytoskeletal protein RodZ